MKKAAFIVNEYNEDIFFGGGEKVNSYIIKELINRNYSVDIYTAVSYVKTSKIVNIYIKDKNFDNNYENILKNYDLVISTNLEYPSEITYSHSHSYMWNKNILNLMFEIIFKKSYKLRINRHKTALENSKKINKIVVSSNIIKQDYIKNYKISLEKIFILPPGVDYREYKLKEINKNKCFTFGLVGKSSIKKGVFVTFKSVSHLVSKNENFKVKIINKEYYKYPLIRILFKIILYLLRINKNIEFMPLQKNMENFYNSIDCLLVPSLKEPFGLVVTEAMSYSVPVIVSSVSGASDLITDKENGIIIDFSNKNKSKELYKAMEYIINISDEEYKKLSYNSWKTIKNMSFDKFAFDFVNLAEKKL